jgi:hypothetical protein
MPTEIISSRTRSEFREYFVFWSVLRDIQTVFRDAGIHPNLEYDPGLGGQRRTLVEQHYRAIDWTNWTDVRKVLQVFEEKLSDLTAIACDPKQHYQENARQDLRRLVDRLKRDGFEYVDGRLRPVGASQHLPDVATVAERIDADELRRQIDRMRDAIEGDPSLAIGTAKEVVETTCKTILASRGLLMDESWDVSRLVKKTREALTLLPSDIPNSAKGTESIRKVLSSLGVVAQGLAELRNLYGTGHGKEGRAKGVSPRHARLAVGAAATLATFLFETHEARE